MRGQPIDALAPLGNDRDEARTPQHSEVLGDGGTRHLEADAGIAGAMTAARKPLEQAAAGWQRQCYQGAIQRALAAETSSWHAQYVT